MMGSMSSVTAFVLRHRRLVMLAWLFVAVAGFATLGSTTKRLSTEFRLPGQPSYIADSKIDALYHGEGGNVPIVIAVTAPAGTSVSAAQADKVLAAAAVSIPNSRLADEYNTGDPAFTTSDGQTSFGLVFPPKLNSFSDRQTPMITAAARAAVPLGWRTGVTGLAQLESGGDQKGLGVLTETLIGGVGSLAVLAFVFASFIAFVPLLMATIAIPTTFLIVGGLTHVTTVSIIVEFLIALIGLGVAIDYSLLVITRWREERAHGYDNHQAVARAMSTAGRAVVFSGFTVGLSLLALIVLPVSFLANIGVAGFLIPIVSVAVALTLLPALLASAGPFLDRPAAPGGACQRAVDRMGSPGIAVPAPRRGNRRGHPHRTHNPDIRPQPRRTKDFRPGADGEAHATLSALQAGGVPTGIIEPIDVLVQNDQAQTVAPRLADIKGVYTAAVSNAQSFNQRGTTIVEVLPSGEPSTSSGGVTISAVRATAAHLPGVIGVGGSGPEQKDFIHAVYGSFPLMLALIGIATLLLLTRAFRSLVLAFKAVVFNLMSVAAAYGIMVLVWQEGHGSRLLASIPATGSITVWVPVMVFAFLFGLSMDYEVFILSRIREEYDRTGSTDDAVVIGIGRTGRLVTSAALILFLGFVSLSTAGLTDLKVMATGLGAGILLDAVVVRCLLVPALVGVLGRWNWYLPPWLARVLWIRQPAAPRPAGPGPEGGEPVLVGVGGRG